MSRVSPRHCSSQWRYCLLGLLLVTQAATVYSVQQLGGTDSGGVTTTGQNVVEDEGRLTVCQLKMESGEQQAVIDNCNKLLAYEELAARFELKQAEDKIDLLQVNALLREEKLDSRNVLLVITATTLLTALVFVVLITLAYRARSVLHHELSSRNRELEAAVDTIREMAAKDPLTGLFNRRAFLEISRHARARCLRENLPMSLTMADIDKFKDLNDTHGHQVGDEVLAEVAQRIQATLRNSDIVFRWGGEEFLCLHPATGLGTAAGVIERVRQTLEGKPISTSGGDMPITMTFGISAIGEDITAAIQAADNAMYQGKRSGRNRIVISKEGPDKPAGTGAFE